MAQEEQIKDTQSNPLPPLENIFFLTVCVLGATDLEAADFGGSSDPYCKVIANKQSWRTQTQNKTINPKWNEETMFVFFAGIEEIQFEIYDEDKRSKSDLLGRAVLSTKDFYNEYNKGFQGWIDLKKCKKGAKIQVKVNGRLIKPLDLEQKCSDLESECKKQENEINKKKTKISELMKTNGQSVETKNKLIQNKQELQVQLVQIKESIKNYNSQNKQKQQDIQKLKQKKNECDFKIDKKEKEIANKKAEIEKEKIRLQQVVNEYENLQQEVNQKKQQLNTYS